MALYTKNEKVLFEAIENNDLKEIKIFLEIVENEKNLLNDEESLFTAVKNNNIEEVKKVLDKGIDVNTRNKNNNYDTYTTIQEYTILILATYYGYIEIIRLLIERNADIDAKDSDGCTALLVASRYGDIEIIKLFLEAGADINAKNKDGETALLLASVRGHLKVAKLLVEVMETRSEQN
jgi:ankyrin repeat protein